MNIEYINPFIEASQSVIKMMLNVDAKMGKVYVKKTHKMSNNIAIFVGLTGKIRGQVVFCMSSETACYIASKMMGGFDMPELNEIAKSAISELTNMILGNTATILYSKGIGIDITPPSFVMGENMQVSSSKATTITVPLIIDPDEGTKIVEIDISVVKE